jgi:hypothetical protein
LGDVGSSGFYWSGSARGSSNAYYLYFNNGYVYPADIISQGRGYAVRCVKN